MCKTKEKERPEQSNCKPIKRIVILQEQAYNNLVNSKYEIGFIDSDIPMREVVKQFIELNKD